MSSKASEYYRRSIGIYEEIHDTAGMARDYTNIGLVLSNMGNNKEALDYHKEALEIDKGLNDRVGMATAILVMYSLIWVITMMH
jgi:tetratricopeptide (TPR) repeat protein